MTLLEYIFELEEAIFECQEKFQQYYEIHLAKNTPEALIKAEENKRMVQLCEKALEYTKVID